MRLDRTERASDDDVPEPRPGVITAMADAARSVVGSVIDETPAEGVAAQPASRLPPKSPRRRRPGWAAVVGAVLAGGPVWDVVEERFLDDEIAAHDVTAAAELGELRGRLDEQSKQIRDIGLRLSANAAADLEASFNGALEFRHLDGKITDLGSNIDRLLAASGVPDKERTELAETPAEITDRHDTQIREYRAAQKKAEREALERSLATSDTVGP
jgi:hypothetical protein